MIQGSEEWLLARCGKVTASRVADVIAKTKSGYAASRANYMAELITERLTGRPAEQYTNAAMQWGTDTEPHARKAYEFLTDVSVEQIGMVDHPAIAMTAASPDGLVGPDGLVEIKCPNTATHIETLLGEAVPERYVTQMNWQMACTGRKWCDFVSFDPRLPEQLRIFVVRIARDDKRIEEIEQEVRKFLVEIDRKLETITAKYMRAA